MRHLKLKIRVFTFAVFLGISSCGGKSKKDDSSEPPQNPPRLTLTVEPTKESIQKNLVDQTCLRCHQTAKPSNREVELADIGKLIDGSVEHGPGHRHGFIKPGCPQQSFFLSIMKEGKMPPPPAAKVAAPDLKAVGDWITSLKPNASCDDDEPGT